MIRLIFHVLLGVSSTSSRATSLTAKGKIWKINWSQSKKKENAMIFLFKDCEACSDAKLAAESKCDGVGSELKLAFTSNSTTLTQNQKY